MLSKIKSKILGLSDGLKSGVSYTFANLITKGIVFLTIPIFTRLMTSSEIGKVNLYSSWFSIFSIITTLSLTSGGYQLALKEFADDKDGYESSVLTITSILSIIVLIIFVVFSDFWTRILGLSKSLLILLGLGLLFNPALDFWMSRQRYDYKYKLSSVVSLASAILASSLSVFLVYYNKDVNNLSEIRLWSNYSVIYGIGLILWLYIFIKGKVFYKARYWKFSLSLSLPLIGHSIAKQILDVSDRMMINSMVGASAVGIYGTLYSISSISLIIWNSINSAYIPYLFKNIDDKEKNFKIRISSTMILLVYCVLAVLMMLLAPEIVAFFATPEYFDAINIMPIIATGVSMTAISNLYSNVLIYYKKTTFIMIASGVAALLNVVLNVIAIPLFGYKAASYTTLLCYIILVVIEGAVATRIYKEVTNSPEMVYSNKSIFLICIGLFAFVVISLFLYSNVVLRYIFIICMIIVTLIYGFKYLKHKM